MEPHRGAGGLLHDFACTLRGVAIDHDPLSTARSELKRLREEVGLTPDEAGKLAGITGQWWRRIEEGFEMKGGIPRRVGLPRSRLIKMAIAVEWPLEEALRCAGMPPLKPAEIRKISTAKPFEDQPSRDRRKLDTLWDSLTRDQKDAITKLVETIVASEEAPEIAPRAPSDDARSLTASTGAAERRRQRLARETAEAMERDNRDSS